MDPNFLWGQEVSQVLHYFLFLAVPHGVWDLGSPTRDGTHSPLHLEAQSPNHWTTRGA